MRKICVITGTRAEYGLLSRLMRLIEDSPLTELQVVATNMHLLPEYGNTYREIEKDGFKINEKVFMPRTSDDSYAIVDSMSEEMRGLNQALRRLLPDLIVILGDRYEMLVAATVAMINHIPVAHLYGGEISEGAFDDSIRHSITKLSHLHFASTEEYRNRIIQLGEHPDRVFWVGAIGVENIKRIPLISKDDIETLLEMSINEKTVLATYHPVTLGVRESQEEISDFLAAIDTVPDLKVVFTMPNSDPGSEAIKVALQQYCSRNPLRCRCFESLGAQKYLSLMQYVGAVIGNSSSGLVEAPSAHIPTLNIGDRQKGRTRGLSVWDVACDRTSISDGLRKVLSPEFRQIAATAKNPYEKEGTAQAIFQAISAFPLNALRQKVFYNLKNE